VLHIDALDEHGVRVQLRSRSLEPLSIRSTSLFRTTRFFQRSQQDFHLLLFAQELLALISAGLSVSESLEALQERTSSARGQLVLQRLLSHLREGKRLSQAMALQTDVFPPLLLGVMQAAEDTSDLPRALQRYIGYETQLQSLKHKVGSAAIYPLILLTVGGGVALFLLGYVVPRFATVYQGNGRDLPWASEWLLRGGQWVATHHDFVMIALFGLALWVAFRLQSNIRTGSWWQLFKWLPGASAKLEILELSRLYLTLSMLLEGGIPISRAMQLASAVLPNQRTSSWEAARLQVIEGDSLSSSLAQHGFSSAVAGRLLRVGERSGQMGAMLGKAAAFHDVEISRWIERFSKAFEPILMATIGLVVGLIVILLYMPIFDLAGSLQP